MMDHKVHIAMIMDGNGRWAQGRGLPRRFGHKAGSEVIQGVVEAAIELNVGCLTLFGLSSDNLKRPQGEIDFIIDLVCSGLDQHLDELNHKGVRLQFIGDIASLGAPLHNKVQQAVEKTKHNQRLDLIVALNFSGRWHTLTTVRQLLHLNKVLSDDDINQAFSSLLPSAPDILIRTGGENRLSDFVMYHLAYAELFFLDIRWPEFRKRHLIEVLDKFNKVERRFGCIEA